MTATALVFLLCFYLFFCRFWEPTAVCSLPCTFLDLKKKKVELFFVKL